MKRIFLSLGFHDRLESDILQDISRAKAIISATYSEVEFVHNYDYQGTSRLDCLGEAIKKMACCDEVYFINNWFNYNGCKIERIICDTYNIPYKSIIV